MDPCWQICLAGKEKEKKRNQSLEWKGGTGKNEVGVGVRKEKEAKDKYEQGKKGREEAGWLVIAMRHIIVLP